MNLISAPPKSHQLAELFREKIRSGQLRPGVRLEPIRVLAENFSVSRQVVLSAFETLVSEGLLFSKVGCGTFVKKVNVPEHNIAITYHKLEGNYYEDELYDSFKREVESCDLNMINCDHNDDPVVFDRYIYSFKNTVSGILIGPVFLKDRLEKVDAVLKKYDIPAVIYHGISNDIYNTTIVNYEKGYFDAVACLAKLGHKRIAFMGLLESHQPKFTAYKRALSANGIDIDESSIISCTGYMYSGYGCVDALIELKPRPTAVMVHNDMAAIGAMQKIQERGLRIPEDISIIGFDDIADASYCNPSLSTVSQPNEEIAKESLAMLLKLIKNPLDKKVENKTYDSRFILRESIGPVGINSRKSKGKSI